MFFDFYNIIPHTFRRNSYSGARSGQPTYTDAAVGMNYNKLSSRYYQFPRTYVEKAVYLSVLWVDTLLSKKAKTLHGL